MKKIICLVLCLTAVLALAACGKTEKKTEVDVTALSEYIMSNVSFEEQLEEVDSDFGMEKLGLADIPAESAFYNSTGAVADICAVIKVENSADLPAVESAVADNIKYLAEGYADYGPKQVPKINSAVVLTVDNTVIFIISNDNTAAEKNVKDYLGL